MKTINIIAGSLLILSLSACKSQDIKTVINTVNNTVNSGTLSNDDIIKGLKE
jgi:hypothetical protein